MLKTDQVIEAIRRTAEIFERNAKKIEQSRTAFHADVIECMAQEMHRARQLRDLIDDDGLCEMLAGRLAEVEQETGTAVAA